MALFFTAQVLGQSDQSSKHDHEVNDVLENEKHDYDPLANPSGDIEERDAENHGLSDEYLKQIEKMGTFKAMKKIMGDKKLKSLLLYNQKKLESIAEEKLESMMIKTLENSPMGPFFKENPKTLKFGIKLIRDKEAVSGIADCMEDKKTWVQYGIFLVISFIVGIFLSATARTDIGLTQKVLRTIGRHLAINLVRVAVFIFLFGHYFSPSWLIFKRVYLS